MSKTPSNLLPCHTHTASRRRLMDRTSPSRSSHESQYTGQCMGPLPPRVPRPRAGAHRAAVSDDPKKVSEDNLQLRDVLAGKTASKSGHSPAATAHADPTTTRQPAQAASPCVDEYPRPSRPPRPLEPSAITSASNPAARPAAQVANPAPRPCPRPAPVEEYHIMTHPPSTMPRCSCPLRTAHFLGTTRSSFWYVFSSASLHEPVRRSAASFCGRFFLSRCALPA